MPTADEGVREAANIHEAKWAHVEQATERDSNRLWNVWQWRLRRRAGEICKFPVIRGERSLELGPRVGQRVRFPEGV